MPMHVKLEACKWAAAQLKDSADSVFTDFLILKREGLGSATSVDITTASTTGSAGRLMGILGSAGAPFDPEHPYFSPFDGKWKKKAYPRFGTYTTIDRSKTLRDVVVVSKAGSGLNVAAAVDYVPAAVTKLKRSKTAPLRVPLLAIAVWASRYDVLPEDIDSDRLIARFIEEYNITAEERAAFFTPGDSFLDLFDEAPLDREAFGEFLRSLAPLSAAASVAVPETPEEALPSDLIEFLRGSLLLPTELLRQIVTLVRAGKNLILTGPPGTGKSTLALRLAEASSKYAAVFDLPASDGHLFTTATADWSTFDTLGGYMPPPDGNGLRFEEGQFLRAIRSNKWVVVDELNRADVDKAFGQFFTVLSGHGVTTAFRVGETEVCIEVDGNLGRSGFREAEQAYVVGTDWRLIATMNTFDRNMLFQLSSAFVRRFAIVHVGIPSTTELKNWIGERDIPSAELPLVEALIDLMAEVRPLGPAIYGDLADYLEVRRSGLALNSDGELDSGSAFAEAVVSFVLPQLDGLDREALGQVEQQLLDIVPDQAGKAFLSEIMRDVL